MKQFYGEKLFRMLERMEVEKEYLNKITGMIFGSRNVDALKDLSMDFDLVRSEAHEAYNILIKDGWTPQKGAATSWPRAKYSRACYHDALFDVARQDRRYSQAATGEAVARALDQGDEEYWHSLWLDSQKFLREIDAAIEAMRLRERKSIDDYLDPDKMRKVHLTPKPRTGYVKLCNFFRQGKCRNGDACQFEHRLPGVGWPTNGPTESVESNAGDDDEDIGSPPTEEGVVDPAQEERDYLAFQRYNYGKGASKGEPMMQEPRRELCLYYGHKSGCKYGLNCKYVHDDQATLEGHREAGKKWDDASRRALREAGFQGSCFDHYLKGRCRVGQNCKYSHEQISDDRLALLRHLVHTANHISDIQDKGGELPSRDSFKFPTATVEGPRHPLHHRRWF